LFCIKKIFCLLAVYTQSLQSSHTFYFHTGLLIDEPKHLIKLTRKGAKKSDCIAKSLLSKKDLQEVRKSKTD